MKRYEADKLQEYLSTISGFKGNPYNITKIVVKTEHYPRWSQWSNPNWVHRQEVEISKRTTTVYGYYGYQMEIIEQPDISDWGFTNKEIEIIPKFIKTIQLRHLGFYIENHQEVESGQTIGDLLNKFSDKMDELRKKYERTCKEGKIANLK